MIDTDFPVFFTISIAIVLTLVIFLLGSLIGPKNPHPIKGEPYECGIPSKGTLGIRYSIKFFLVALIFLIFDVEVVFLFPWATVFREFHQQGYGTYIFLSMVFFLFLLVLGLFYDWKKGGLKWE